MAFFQRCILKASPVNEIRLSCRACGKETVFYASDLDSEIPCDNDKCLELQPFARENIEEIEFYLVSHLLLVQH
jgi:hypothetical protein